MTAYQIRPLCRNRLVAQRAVLFSHGGSPVEYGAGVKLAIERDWITMHESGTYVRFTQSGSDLFA